MATVMPRHARRCSRDEITKSPFSSYEALNEYKKNYANRFIRQLITGTVTAPTAVTKTTCICVPPGSCPNQSNDGSGQLDIRIVTNPSDINTPVPNTCSYALARCCLNSPYQCGVRYPPPPGSAPSGPGQAAFGAYPWQAAILTLGEIYLGSGALVSSKYVLTVAHKVNNVPIASIKVRLGEWNASGITEPIPAQDFQITRLYIHPEFNSNNLYNDVALIRLASEVQLGPVPTIASICLSPNSFSGQKCYVAGWGKDDFNGLYQAIQKEVDVTVISTDTCQEKLRKTRLGPNFVLNGTTFVCAGGENGKDACTGDGGSPLVCSSNGRWYAVGLVAWGIGCAVKDVPGVYVNLSTYIPWIESIIAQS
ncbi:phenoloxidase-activating factor 2-like [Condylostylus longicornis]|uniref:phenoloxidase-activating factor 2-like n=1 Tax=Condylostylus longicornis TaxID=2530218 RepID=UPI00244DAF8F|nr:phenoloxidase-activating factor 2-like [Condylostylus longicornis]